jgi:pyruvate formate lyase activating enzyme
MPGQILREGYVGKRRIFDMKRTVSRREFLSNCGRCALFLAGLKGIEWISLSAESHAQELEKGFLGRKVSPYFAALNDGSIQCQLCPRLCHVDKGKRGYCRVRENVEGQYYSLVYGNPCAVNVDPIEKKPFFHVLPSSLSFSIATAGCNLNCKFCQNWEISQARPDDTLNYNLPPKKVVDAAKRYQCYSIASTYVEPTIFIEYMLAIGQLAREQRILKVIHSNGYINTTPLQDLCKVLDAACIDLKGFTDDYYRDLTEGSLGQVLATLKQLKDSKVHTEVVNLLVPGKNDAMEQIRAMCRWIRTELGPEVPLHFTRFQPLYKLKSLQPTPVATLEQAWKTALDEGLHYVYLGNVPGHEAEHTNCPNCKTRLIERIGYKVRTLQLQDGKCGRCGQTIPGIWKA